ncbi:MAG: methionine adenosyltransferase [Actinomycetaceae bacterium]|nr:methionine adenosyltransferase [Actinomycetaceae bacterium]
MPQSRLFTSESVTSGHPDKVCDQISDAILDSALRQDPDSRVAVETMATTQRVIVAGEISSSAHLDIDAIVRNTVRDIGYTVAGIGFDADSLEVQVIVDQQSPDIAQSVSQSLEVREEKSTDPHSVQGAGDQGLMFGYATDETPEYMPIPISLAHRLARQIETVRRTDMPQLRPDGKTQVTVKIADGHVIGIDTVVISTQHDDATSLSDLREGIGELVVAPVLADLRMPPAMTDTRVLINPSGRFVAGGPSADTGVTGRKIIVDTYGGYARHGGGAFSGKDASKVDRSASYALRWIAKNIVAAGLAQRCELQVSYAIGRAEPVSVWVETFGTGIVDDAVLIGAIRREFDLRPSAIIEALALTQPNFQSTAAYGHFGRPEFTWEQLTHVDCLRQYAG